MSSVPIASCCMIESILATITAVAWWFVMMMMMSFLFTWNQLKGVSVIRKIAVDFLWFYLSHKHRTQSFPIHLLNLVHRHVRIHASDCNYTWFFYDLTIFKHVPFIPILFTFPYCREAASNCHEIDSDLADQVFLCGAAHCVYWNFLTLIRASSPTLAGNNDSSHCVIRNLSCRMRLLCCNRAMLDDDNVELFYL